jgi:hypothetical protein
VWRPSSTGWCLGCAAGAVSALLWLVVPARDYVSSGCPAPPKRWKKPFQKRSLAPRNNLVGRLSAPVVGRIREARKGHPGRDDLSTFPIFRISDFPAGGAFAVWAVLRRRHDEVFRTRRTHLVPTDPGGCVGATHPVRGDALRVLLVVLVAIASNEPTRLGLADRLICSGLGTVKPRDHKIGDLLPGERRVCE